MLEVLHSSEFEIKKLKSPVPVLLDFRGSYADQKFFDEFKSLMKQYSNSALKSATFGITGVKMIIASAITRFNGSVQSRNISTT
jgi:hypothetical protein